MHSLGLPNEEGKVDKLTELPRNKWDMLVDKFINTPAMITQSAIDNFVPGGSDDPRLFKEAKGRIVIIGPDLPAGKKISGHERAKVEVFRGALRTICDYCQSRIKRCAKIKRQSVLNFARNC